MYGFREYPVFVRFISHENIYDRVRYTGIGALNYCISSEDIITTRQEMTKVSRGEFEGGTGDE